MNVYKTIRKTAYLKSLQNTYSVQLRSKVGYVVGVYESDGNHILTESAKEINNHCSGGLNHQLNYGGPLKAGKSRVLFGLSEAFPIVSVVGLGKRGLESNPLEERDESKEAVRKAVGAGCTSLKEYELEKLIVDPCGDGCSAGEGASLSIFSYQELKSKKKKIPNLECLNTEDQDWVKGVTLAEGQNIARRLMEMPGNILTPTNFAQETVNCLERLGVEVSVRTQAWAKEMRMNAFLSVAKGSSEPPVFLELSYKGGEGGSRPLAIVGKGITFDSGGTSLKPGKNMDKMRADMGGAACTVGSMYSAACLKLPINIKGFVPLCENMPSGCANKPGDVVIASNGKSIQIDNTDAEGRLILADALHYASLQKPRVIVDMATLTGAMMVALGAGPTGVFSNSTSQWAVLQKAGYITGDRVWRMPMFEMYEKQVKDFGMADVHNIGKYGNMAGASLAAVFLKQFVTCDHWMHLDIAGVMENKDEVPYLGKGMSGRPTRTIATYASLLADQKQ